MWPVFYVSFTASILKAPQTPLGRHATTTRSISNA